MVINYEKISASIPKLARGQVWCRTCGHMQTVNAALCMQHGWPTHCDETMTIDSPEERTA